MKAKLLVYALPVLILATIQLGVAQQPKKVPRIGYVSGSGDANNPGSNLEGFRQGLRDLGYVDGKNIQVEYRYAEGKADIVPRFVAELVQLKVDVLVLSQLSAIRAAKQATKTIPIIMVTSVDPVAAGLIDSLARPGGNITGVTVLTRDLSGKRLELLKEVVPTISRVGILLVADSPFARTFFNEYESTARALKIQLQSMEVRRENPDFVGAFHNVAKGRVRALITMRNALLIVNRKQIADLAIKNRLPSMHERSDMVEAGGLVSYAANEADNSKRAAIYVDKILKGTKPAELPVEQPMKFELVINLKTAKKIGLTIPPNVLARADKVIR